MALRNGIRLPVGMAEVFPYGCCLVPDSIVEAQDYDERTGRRTPAVDRVTGKRVFQCRVSDLDPERAGRSRETVVKILADQQPQPPTRPPFEQVVTVPVDGRSLVAFQRTVTVPPHVLPVLAEHMASWAGPDRVFVGRDGRPMRGDAVRQAFDGARRKAGLPGCWCGNVARRRLSFSGSAMAVRG